MILRTTLCLLFTALPAFAAEAPMPILFHQRPPLYYIAPDGSGQPVYAGHVYVKVRDTLLRAGIPAEFREMPGARVVSLIKSNSTPLCAMGWFKTEERSRFAQFSVPLHQDRPWLIVTRPEHEATVRQLGSLEAVLAHRRLLPTLMGGLSYGSQIDALLRAHKLERVAAGPSTVLKMIDAGHGDYTIIPADALEDHLSRVNPGSRLRGVAASDIAGEPLYLMCSKQVPAAWLARFNAAWTAGTARNGAAGRP